jgi:hypothetical protein
MFEKSLTMYQILLDPPKSTTLATSRQSRPTQCLPLKRGTLILVPPLKSARGDLNVLKVTAKKFSNNLLYQFKIQN